MIVVFLALLCLTQTGSLTGTIVSQACHCDLTPSLCDIDCCCDSSCSNTQANCYNLKSNSFCPDPAFFSRLASTASDSNGCFYYNSTSTIIEEVTLSNSQRNQIVIQNQPVKRVSVVNNNGPATDGYKQGDAIASFNFIDSTIAANTCLMATNSATPLFELRFGLNLKLICPCPTCTTSPFLYSFFNEKTIPKYKGDSTITVSFPTLTDPKLTNVQINIIVGTYGSGNGKYIERITSSTSSSISTTTTRTLSITFIQPEQLQPLSSSPTFFPQIPLDMFYPIYLLS